MNLFDELCSIYFPFDRQNYVAVFSVYCDESYTHHDVGEPFVFGVGGYVAYREHWEGFDAEWKAALDAKGLTEFHMTDYEHNARAFAGGGFEPLLNELVGIIHNHEIQPFVCFTRFDRKMSSAELTQRYADLVRLTVEMVVTTYRTIAETGELLDQDDRFVFFLDRCPDHDAKKLVRASWDEPRDEAPWRFKLQNLEWYDKKEIRPIQAADILIFDMVKHARKELVESDGRRVFRYTTDRLRERRNIHRFELRWPTSDGSIAS